MLKLKCFFKDSVSENGDPSSSRLWIPLRVFKTLISGYFIQYTSHKARDREILISGSWIIILEKNVHNNAA